MSVFFDFYEIDFRFHGIDFPLEPGRTSFSINDSIYSLYNTASITVEDRTGELSEQLSFVKGTEVEIDYGIKDYAANKGKYVIVNSHFPETGQGQPGIVSGKVEMRLKNAWYAQQEIHSRAFNDSIDSILRTLTGGVGAIRRQDISSTDGVDVWYQPMINDAEFIENVLLPNSFSFDAPSTPFYAYITTDGVFHFKPAAAMYSANITDELEYPTNLTPDTTQPQKVLELRNIREDKDLERHLLNRDVFRIDTDTGRLIREDDSITDHISPSNKKFPFVADLSLKQDYVDQNREEPTIDERNAEIGRLNYSHRPGMFIDRFIIITPLNPKLHSGQKINLITHTAMKNDRTDESPTFTDNYVIENAEHIWNSEQTRGFTKLIVGRKYLRGNRRYDFRQKLAPRG